MTDATLTEALKEAYASAPSDITILHTLELRHPAFIDEQGRKTASLTAETVMNEIKKCKGLD